MSEQKLDAYERLALPGVSRTTKVFLYACHFDKANSLQIGFGMESASGLQRSHIGGPMVHELHVGVLADWLRQEKRVNLVQGLPAAKRHPATSVGQTVAGYDDLLHFLTVLNLEIDRYEPLVGFCKVPEELVIRYGDLISRVQHKSFGHPKDWDFQSHDLPDGRFVWVAYDDDLKKIRIGMGIHDAANEKAYGEHTYALGLPDIASFCAHHFVHLDAPIQFMGLPARWPSAVEPFLYGPPKQAFIATLLKYADSVWPGQIGDM